MTETPFPNQPDPYADRNLYLDDAALREGVAREGGAFADAALRAAGERWGAAATFALAERANRCVPRHHPFDARGERIDAIELDPAWHALMTMAWAAGEHCEPWRTAIGGAHVARAAHVLLHAQAENGTQCPVTMTYACVPVLRRHAATTSELGNAWLPKVLADDYDPRALPLADKRSAIIGMGMTERQGGSDVRSNRTRAVYASDGAARLTGHKWFFSVPQADAHLVLARDDRGPSCFLVPRFMADGARNRIAVQRLKDKLGNRSNASSEVEFDQAWGLPVGEPGQGIATILEMVRYTRLDCALGSTGILRAAFARALDHARQRIVFGRPLDTQPLMRNVLADLALEVEAATALVLRLARLFEAAEDSSDGALARVLTPAAKFWICKRGPALAAEAMEVLGGNGYVEDSGLPRLYRELPVNAIWEGSGNIMALDSVRAATREPEVMDAIVAELDAARGAYADYDRAVPQVRTRMAAAADDPAQARAAVQALVLALQGSLLIRHAPTRVAEAFCASRFAASAFAGGMIGTLPVGHDGEGLLQRALPR